MLKEKDFEVYSIIRKEKIRQRLRKISEKISRIYIHYFGRKIVKNRKKGVDMGKNRRQTPTKKNKYSKKAICYPCNHFVTI